MVFNPVLFRSKGLKNHRYIVCRRVIFLSEPRNLMLDGPDSLKVIKSLSCPIRLKILNLLATQMLSISDIASELDISLQSAGLKVKQLREAGLIHTYTQSGIRGSQRICSRLKMMVKLWY